jgi:HSP20 family protein
MNDKTPLRDSEAVARRERDSPAGRMTPLPVDVYEGSQGIILWAEPSGVTKEKLDVKVHDSRLYIEAEAVAPTPANLRLLHADMHESHFSRAFSLRAAFDTSKIDANLRDGVLKLMIPRHDEARPRRIEIHSG